MKSVAENLCISKNLWVIHTCFKMSSKYWRLQSCFYNPVEHQRWSFLCEENLRSQSCQNKSQTARNHMYMLYKFQRICLVALKVFDKCKTWDQNISITNLKKHRLCNFFLLFFSVYLFCWVFIFKCFTHFSMSF